eukprot:g19409.t1
MKHRHYQEAIAWLQKNIALTKGEEDVPLTLENVLGNKLNAPFDIATFYDDLIQGSRPNLQPILHKVNLSDANMVRTFLVLALSFLGHCYECGPSETSFIEQVNPMRAANCPPRPWIKDILQTILLETSSAIIVVGCNKGNDFVKMLEAFSGNKTYNPQKYADFLKEITWKRGRENGVSSCLLEGDSVRIEDQPVRPIRGWCIEPLPGNVRFLNSTFKKFGFDPQSAMLLPVAVSGTVGMDLFANSSTPGAESFGLHNAKMYASTIEVEIVTLDSLIEREHFFKVDFVSIDAEGGDPLVILGMVRSLALKKVRAFEFEYHFVGHWNTERLLSYVLILLDNLGYECYIQANSGDLYPLTGCWTDFHWVNRYWSNVLCVDREQENLFLLVQKRAKKAMGTRMAVGKKVIGRKRFKWGRGN